MSDYIVRAVAADAQVRAFACLTRDTVEEARKRHNTSPVITAALGRLLSAGAMMGSMMKGEKDLLTLQIKGDGPVKRITVTADAQGNVKGYASNPVVLLPANEKGKLDVSGAIGKGSLSVIRDMGLKEPYVGETLLKTGEIAEDLTYYFAASEQVPSSVGLGVLMDRNNTVRQAGGFIIQLMPFAKEEVITKIEENMANIQSVTTLFEEGKTPEQILELILKDLQMSVTDTMPVRFFCGCDKKRIEKALISIGKDDLNEMIQDGKDIEVNCHFCNTNYTFTTEELSEMQKQSR